MKQPSKDSRKIAWFKLSEFIDRGEKERALGIYKLLRHTINNEAFAKQLEGDLLLFFNEESATNAYESAALLYEKDGNISHATALYEHLTTQFPHKNRYLKKLVHLYTELNHPTRITLSLKRLIPHLIDAEQLSNINNALHTLEPILPYENQTELYECVTFELIEQQQDDDLVLEYIKKTIETIQLAQHNTNLFIKKLGQHEPHYQKEAKKYLKGRS
jgi:hypothetical protein